MISFCIYSKKKKLTEKIEQVLSYFGQDFHLLNLEGKFNKWEDRARARAQLKMGPRWERVQI